MSFNRKILVNKSQYKFQTIKMLNHSRSTSVIQRPLSAVPKRSEQSNQIKQISSSRQTLSHLIPDMPAFMTKSKSSTANLYSKFIMKGINTNKLDLVKKAFNMKKENLTYQRKMSHNFMKTIKNTINSTKNETLTTIKYLTNEKSQYNQKSYKNDGSNKLNLEINNIYKVSLNKKQLHFNENELKLTNVQSQRIIGRPKSAVTTPFTGVRTARAKTASHHKMPSASYNRQNFDQNDFKTIIPEKNLLTTVSSQLLNFGFVNHIKRNKRQLSASSKKTSIYLTGLEGPKIVENNDQQIIKIPTKKLYGTQKGHGYSVSMHEIPDEDENEFERKQTGLSHKQTENIKDTNKKNLSFMKQNMPKQYKKYVQYLAMQQNNFTQKDNILLSVNLDQNFNEFEEIRKNSMNQNQAIQQAKNYLTDYAHLCQETEYQVSKFLKKKQEKKVFDQVLHVGMCQEILTLETQRRQISQKQRLSEEENQRLTQIKQIIYDIVRILTFFKSKSQEECQKLFKLNFSIFSVEENETIINKYDQIDQLYVILNGSVVKTTTKQSKNQSESVISTRLNNQVLICTNTLFDGQSFGQPDNKFDKIHNSHFKSAEKVLLMAFSYKQYRHICLESQDMGERIKMLKSIFGNVSGCKPLNHQELELLGFQLQTTSFVAKDIIFRKGQACDKLIIVALGKVLKVNQHILKRKKKNSKDIRKKSKSTSKLQIQHYSVQKLRRNNLKNYQVLKQNQQQFIYYYQDISNEFICGDVINYQGFSYNYRQPLKDKESFVNETHKGQSNKQSQKNEASLKLDYSLISNADNTKIYTLQIKNVQKLPQTLKQVIYAKISHELKKEKQSKIAQIPNQKINSIQKWDSYKQKICNDIISRKLKV